MRWLMFLMLWISSTMAWAQTGGQMTVTGSGVVTGPPDMAIITLGVTEEAEDAADAVAQMSDNLAAVLAGLSQAGIAEPDIQTQRLQLAPVWSNRGSLSKTPPSIEGFTASSDVTVRVTDLSQLGLLLDTVVGLGANGFKGLSFGLQDPDPAQDEARRRAVADAQAKAALYAEAAGVTLGPIIHLSEGFGAQPAETRMMAGSLEAAVPVAAGSVSISAQVTIIFGLIE